MCLAPTFVPKSSSEMDWGPIFYALSHEFGWTPKQIGELTEAQLAGYLKEIRRNKGQNVMSRREVEEAQKVSDKQMEDLFNGTV